MAPLKRAEGKTARILIVEDEVLLALFMAQDLTSAGFRIVGSARRVSEAVQIADRKRPDIAIVGVVEPDDQLFEKYAARYNWPASLHFRNIEELAAQAHPQVALVFTSTAGHRAVVEKCATLGINVMMEKPMTVSEIMSPAATATGWPAGMPASHSSRAVSESSVA